MASNIAEKRQVLEAFSRDFKREMHNLQKRPDILWQQMYNRLQWADEGREDGPVSRTLTPEYEKRTSQGTRPWFHNRRRIRESEALIRVFAGHTSDVNSCCFSPDGSRIASASDDDTVRLWDAATGSQLATLEGHADWVHSCAFSPDGRTIVSASEDKTLKLWDAVSGEELSTCSGHTSTINSCAFSPDGRTIVSASDDSTLTLWDVERCKSLRTLTGHTGKVNSCSFSPDGKRIVSASDDRTVRLWDAESGEELITLNGHCGAVNCCVFLPDSMRILSASSDHTLKFWNPGSGELLESYPALGSLYGCNISTDGVMACCGDSGGNLYILELHGFEAVKTGAG